MLFNSPVFLVFATVFLAGWHMLRAQGSRLRLLVVASFIFYGYWDWRFIFLLAGSGTLDYLVARLIAASPAGRRRAGLLVLSLLGNLGALAFFKYLGFFTDNVEAACASIGLAWSAPSWADRIVLPVGISFYTFQSMSYTIDVYRGVLQPTRRLTLFFAYLSMFPQLVAGPIERATHLMPQLERRRTPSVAECADGWRLIVVGFFKKVFIADNIAPFVDGAFRNATLHDNGAFWWLVAAMFAVQIYGDFSGYSDIARGLARLMGLDLMLNFDHPYNARSMRDFWRRWHISLSTWFRDYVYVPLGGSRHGPVRARVALWMTFLISGFWHGASWTFIVWGAMHAGLLMIDRGVRRTPVMRIPAIIRSPLGWLLVLLAVVPTWIVFRADTIEQAMSIYRLMLTPSSFAKPVEGWSLAMTALIVYVCRIVHVATFERVPRLELHWLEPVVIPLLVVITVFFRGPGNAFIYFQF